MRKHHRGAAAIAAGAALASLCGQARASDLSVGQIAALKEIQSIYRGVGVLEEQGRVHMIYGVPMGGGVTPRDSAMFWLQNFGEAIGGGGSTFQEAWSAALEDGLRTVFCFQQYIGGVPVEYGMVKVVVLHGPTNPVVFVGTTVAPSGGFPRAAVNAETALAIVRAEEQYANLPTWSKPELVIYQGQGDWIAPVRAWKFVGEVAAPDTAVRKTFFVNEATGALAGVRDEVLHDVGGTIRGMGTSGLAPDTASNLPVLLGMPEIKVTGSPFGGIVFSDRAGSYNLSVPVLLNTTVATGVGSSNGFGGRWVAVFPTGLTPQSASGNGTSPATVNLTLNSAPGATTTAQINAFIGTNSIHNYFRDRAGTFTLLDTALRANTGVSGTCNAFFNGSSINFYNAGGGCPNSAYSTVISHEYGHFIVSKLGPGGAGLPQNAFGEGYGDTVAMLNYDTPVIAQDFFGVGSPIRNPATANRQYPCSGEIHDCGQVLAGAWWDLRLNMGAFYGQATGLANTRQLQVSWSLITAGGPNSTNSAGPSTLVEVLTADDNDGNLNNGTPNSARICPAFASHSITSGFCGGGGPANNGCANAATITNGSTPFNTAGATTDGPTEANCSFCCGDLQVNQDIWYTYTATATGTVTVSLCGASYDSKVAVYDGAGCPSGNDTAIACNDDSCGLQSQCSFSSVAGQQYKIRVGGYQAATGSGNIVISVVPGNDACGSAFPISEGTTPFSTEGATTDGPQVTCAGFGDPQVNQDVWYDYTASISGMATLSLCGGAAYDSKVAVYAGTTCPVANGSEIACNDDSCGLQSQCSFAVTAGSHYRVRIGGFLTAVGSGTFNISVVPVNDPCSGAVPIGNGNTAFSNAGATTDGPTEANCSFCCGDLQVNNDIWYRYTATCSGQVTISLCGSGYDTKVAVYAGGCPSAPDTAIACNDDSCGLQSQTSFTATQGTAYLIRVGGYQASVGSGTINIACAGCYADCDHNGTLNVNDFICFQNAFAASQPYADCDGNGSRNVNDFICYQSRYAAGCP